MFLPCYNIEKELNKKFNKDQLIMMLSGNYKLGTKKHLWLTLKNKYGRQKAKTIMPNTYIMPEDLNLFYKEFDKKKIYILKKEIQRQEGLKISNSLEEILDNINEYKVVQEYNKDSFLFNKRKINIRVYLFITCYKGKITGYVFDDGIITYTGMPYDRNSTDFNNCIASFYTSDDLYDRGWPILTSQLFSKSLLTKKINKRLGQILEALHTNICKRKSVYDNMTAELFGVDFFLDNKLNVQVLEINKGPGMIPYNKYDHKMRTRLQYSILDLLKLSKPYKDNGFTLVS